MTTAAELEAQVNKFSTNMDRFDDLINATSSTLVTTDNGPVFPWSAIQEQVIGLNYQTRAELYAELAYDAGYRGYVWGDSTSSYNGVYKKLGASGAGSWSKIGDLPSSWLVIASQATAEAGTDNTEAMTPLRTAQYVTARKANQSEAEAGTDSDKLMTPQRTYQQVTARKADTSTAQAGTDNDLLMTPLRTAQYVTGIQATVTEAQEATSATALMSPLRTKQQIDNRLATQTEGQEGTNTTQLMTPIRVANYFTGQRATLVEAGDGVEGFKYVTPQSAYYQNTLRIADQATAEGLTDNDKLMTALRVDQLIAVKAASTAEVIAETVTDKYVNPVELAGSFTIRDARFNPVENPRLNIKHVTYKYLAADGDDIVIFGAEHDNTFVANTGVKLLNPYEDTYQGEYKIIRHAIYQKVIINQNDEILWGLKHDGTVVASGALAQEGTTALSSPTWSTYYGSLIPIFMLGQSLSQGTKSFKPDEVANPLLEAPAPGRVFQFGSVSARFLEDNTATKVNDYMNVSVVQELADNKESFNGGTAIMSSGTFIRKFLERTMNDDSAFVIMNGAIGGQNLATVTSGAPLRNRRIAFKAANEYACRNVTDFAPRSIILLDHQNADRNESFADYKQMVIDAYNDFADDIGRNGGVASEAYMTTTSGQACYSSTVNSSDVPLVGLDLAKDSNYPRISVWGPEYIIEVAVGALAAFGLDDTIHAAAIGQARKGLYQEQDIYNMMNGTPRLPLHCDIDGGDGAVLAGDGLSATIDYTNPRSGSLVVDTTTVTNPAVAGYDDADSRRPYGYMFASADGKSPHSSGILVTNVSVSLNTVTVTFSADATAAVAGGAMINVANYYEGQSAGGDDPGGIVSGPDRGARACVRTVDFDSYTLTDPSGPTDTVFNLYDWVMPQRIPFI